jgi:hypothetical protein
LACPRRTCGACRHRPYDNLLKINGVSASNEDALNELPPAPSVEFIVLRGPNQEQTTIEVPLGISIVKPTPGEVPRYQLQTDAFIVNSYRRSGERVLRYSGCTHASAEHSSSGALSRVASVASTGVCVNKASKKCPATKDRARDLKAMFEYPKWESSRNYFPHPGKRKRHSAAGITAVRRIGPNWIVAGRRPPSIPVFIVTSTTFPKFESYQAA